MAWPVLRAVSVRRRTAACRSDSWAVHSRTHGRSGNWSERPMLRTVTHVSAARVGRVIGKTNERWQDTGGSVPPWWRLRRSRRPQVSPSRNARHPPRPRWERSSSGARNLPSGCAAMPDVAGPVNTNPRESNATPQLRSHPAPTNCSTVVAVPCLRGSCARTLAARPPGNSP